MMESVDGNAIGGLLIDVFGVEMTNATGVCATCGATGQLAQFEVFLRAPGVVVRCRSCRNVVMVLVTVREMTCVDQRGLAELAIEPRYSRPQ